MLLITYDFFAFVHSEINSFQNEKLTAITVLAKKLYGKRKITAETMRFSSCELMKSAMHKFM